VRGCRARSWCGCGCVGADLDDDGWVGLECKGWLHERVGGYLDDDGWVGLECKGWLHERVGGYRDDEG
jgi:hypothetical protein